MAKNGKMEKRCPSDDVKKIGRYEYGVRARAKLAQQVYANYARFALSTNNPPPLLRERRCLAFLTTLVEEYELMFMSRMKIQNNEETGAL